MSYTGETTLNNEITADFLIAKASSAFGRLLFEVVVWVQLARLSDPTHYLCQYYRSRKPNAAAGPAWSYMGSYNFQYIDDAKYVKCLEPGIMLAVRRFSAKLYDDNRIDKTSIVFKLANDSKYSLMGDMEEEILTPDEKHEMEVWATKFGANTAEHLARKDTGYSNAQIKFGGDIAYAGNTCLKFIPDGNNFKYSHVKIDEIGIENGLYDVKWTFRKAFWTKYELQDLLTKEEYAKVSKNNPVFKADHLNTTAYTVYEITDYDEQTDTTNYYIVVQAGACNTIVRSQKLHYKVYHYTKYFEQADRWQGVALLEPYYERMRKIQEQALLAEELMLRGINPPQWQSSIYFKAPLDIGHGARNEIDVSMLDNSQFANGGFRAENAFGILDTKVAENMEQYRKNKDQFLRDIREALYLDAIDAEDAEMGKPGNPKTAYEISELAKRGRSMIQVINEPGERQQESLLKSIVGYLLHEVHCLFEENPELKILRDPEEYRKVSMQAMLNGIPDEVHEQFMTGKKELEVLKSEYDNTEDYSAKRGVKFKLQTKLKWLKDHHEMIHSALSLKIEDTYRKEIEYIKKKDFELYFALSLPQTVVDLMTEKTLNGGSFGSIIRPEVKGQTYKFAKQRELADQNNTIMAVANIAQSTQDSTWLMAINKTPAVKKYFSNFNTLDIYVGDTKFDEALEADAKAKQQAQEQQAEANNQEIQGKAIENMNEAQE